METLQAVAVASIALSKTNPRSGNYEKRLGDLVESVRTHGVLEPVVVRPLPGKNGASFELVCGHRRLKAAQRAELTEIPAIVRELTDEQALEIQLIENLQREDLHPLDEAEGYRQLMARAKYDVARIAERIGRSVKYVYDRVKLLQLVPEAKKAFLDDRITAGHAILLARLKPEDQKRALDPDDGGVFEHEHVLWSPSEERERGQEDLKPRSVRELQGWIDEEVRFDVESPDLLQLFPDTAAAVDVAEREKRKVIPITHSHYIQEEARGEGRTYGPRSWQRADGEPTEDRNGRTVKSKTCEKSGLGVVMSGPGRGEAFQVCVNRSCPVHFPQQAAKAKKKAAATASPGEPKRDTWAERHKAEQERKAKAWEAYKRALPQIVEATKEALRKAPAGVGGPLHQILKVALHGSRGALLEPGRSAEDLVRHLASVCVSWRMRDSYSYESFVRGAAKALKVDVAKLVKAAAPTPEKKAAEKPAKAKKRGRS